MFTLFTLSLLCLCCVMLLLSQRFVLVCTPAFISAPTTSLSKCFDYSRIEKHLIETGMYKCQNDKNNSPSVNKVNKSIDVFWKYTPHPHAQCKLVMYTSRKRHCHEPTLPRKHTKSVQSFSLDIYVLLWLQGKIRVFHTFTYHGISDFTH